MAALTAQLNSLFEEQAERHGADSDSEGSAALQELNPSPDDEDSVSDFTYSQEVIAYVVYRRVF